MKDQLKRIWMRFASNKRGHVAIITAAAAPALIASVGLGTEVGYWYYKERTAQMAVDIGAFTGAMEARSGGTISEIQTEAVTDATTGGYDPARGAITVNWPPTSGTNQNLRSVEVITTQSYPRLFSGVFFSGDVSFTRRAVASYREPGPACILSLHPSDSQSLAFTGSSDTTLTDCEVQANSIANDALYVGGSGSLTTTCANSVGGIDVTSSLILTGCPESRIDVPPALDPYENLVPPTPAACNGNGNGGGNGGGNGNGNGNSNSGPETFSPGTFCGGMTIQGEATFDPGVYIIDGGTLRLNAGAIVSGSDVTFYLTGDAEVRFNGGADIDFSAPSSGGYAGVLFWGDENNSSSTFARFNGTADSALKGALYFPNQDVDFLGDFGNSNGCTRIIGMRVYVSGNSSFDSNCTDAGAETINVPGAVLLTE